MASGLLPSLAGKVALITGASRGIGANLAVSLAKAGCDVIVTAKSVESTPELPGSIYTVAEEVEAAGARALPLRMDVRDDDAVEEVVQKAAAEMGRIDFLVCNAGALWWQPIEKTPMARYDLINGINARATFAVSKAVLPVMREQKFGHIVTQSPPIAATVEAGMHGKVGYSMSKLGMTICAVGIAQEYAEYNVTANSIWPATLIESYATINHKLGTRKFWRKSSILTDSITIMLGEEPSELSGKQLIDEEYLRSKGVTDFSSYQCEPGFEPPPLSKLGAQLSAGRARDAE